MSDYRQIGTCAVDSGQIMIADPCYLVNDNYTEKDYDATIAVTCADTGPQCGPDLGGLVVSAATGVGDGNFPVYGTFDGHKLVSVEIVFSEDNEDTNTAWDAEEED